MMTEIEMIVELKKENARLKSALKEAVIHLGNMISFTRDPKWQRICYMPDCNDDYHTQKQNAIDFYNALQKLRAPEVKI